MANSKTQIFTNVAIGKIAKIICQKKQHSKTFETMVFKWNQHKLHIGRLIMIQFEDDWRKTLAVFLFCLTNSVIYLRFRTIFVNIVKNMPKIGQKMLNLVLF